VNLFFDRPAIEEPHIKYKIHEASGILADERLAGKMLIPKGTALHRIIRLCLEEGAPVGIETYYILKEVLPALPPGELKRQNIAELIQSASHHGIAGNNQKVTLVYANDEESRLLKIGAGQPLMKHKGMVYDNKGQLLVFFENVLRFDRFSFYRKEAR
jgi:DNA-binding GntR family transcriptional regulator